MPIYEYECPNCGSFEHSQSIHERPLHKCPKCRRKVQRMISATSFQLKGGGWYAQGYQKGGGSVASPKSGDASTTAKKAEEKPAASTPTPSSSETTSS